MRGLPPRATLCAVYSLMEHFGVHFSLNGDVVPDARDDLVLPRDLHRVFTPRFSVQGLLPFHEFPMGPNLWRALVTNMVKSKLKFSRFHTCLVHADNSRVDGDRAGL